MDQRGTWCIYESMQGVACKTAHFRPHTWVRQETRMWCRKGNRAILNLRLSAVKSCTRLSPGSVQIQRNYRRTPWGGMLSRLGPCFPCRRRRAEGKRKLLIELNEVFWVVISNSRQYCGHVGLLLDNTNPTRLQTMKGISPQHGWKVWEHPVWPRTRGHVYLCGPKVASQCEQHQLLSSKAKYADVKGSLWHHDTFRWFNPVNFLTAGLLHWIKHTYSE